MVLVQFDPSLRKIGNGRASLHITIVCNQLRSKEFWLSVKRTIGTNLGLSESVTKGIFGASPAGCKMPEGFDCVTGLNWLGNLSEK